MEGLTRRDLQALLEFLRDLYALRDLDAFRAHIVRVLPRLIPSGVDGARLLVRLLADGVQRVLLLEEQRPAQPDGSLESLGLTRREAEVLAWVSEGKTNAEIGVILRASRRTVDKHLEHIYRKLGVETRAAAIRLALTAPSNEQLSRGGTGRWAQRAGRRG